MAPRSLRLLPLLVLLVVMPAAAQDQRAFLEVSINGVAKGDTLVVLRDDDALVAVEMLTGAGMRDFAGSRELIGDAAYVSLTSLAPAITFTTNERDLRLSITANPNLLGETVQDLQTGAPAGIVHRSATSGFLNYAVSSSGRNDYDIYTESAMSAGGGLFYNTTSMTPAGVVRGLTNLTYDQRSSLRRWVIGDNFAGGTALGGDALLNGISISREYSLSPYFVRYPTLSMSTSIAAPSVVEVHVNGRLVRQEDVQPGRLDLRNLPLTTGANDTKVIVRDPFGGTRELSTSYYLTTSVLAPGLQDYQYAVGFRRNSFGRASFDYSAPALFARHRIGVADWFSAGYRLEAEKGLTNTGALLNLRVPFGELEGAASISRTAAGVGNAAQVAYSYATRAGSVGATVQSSSPRYMVIGRTATDVHAPREVSVYAGLSLPRGMNLSLQHGQSFGDLSVRQERSSVVASARLFRIADMTASYTRFTGPNGTGTELAIGMTMSFGGKTVASANAVQTAEGIRSAVDVQRPLPVGTGYGYQMHTETGMRQASSGMLQYQGSHGRYEVRQEISNGEQHTNVSVAGALVGIGGGLYATRPVRNSFALVRVPGVDGVRTYSSHQEIGRTNKGGNVLIPDLLPYYGNELNIADTDIPIDFTVSDVKITLAPPYRGGAVVLFPARRIQRATGVVLLATAAGDVQPSYGELTIVAAGERLASPLGNSGEFYFENLPEGRHEASVTHEGRSCSFMLTVPHSEEAAISLGTLKCTLALLR